MRVRVQMLLAVFVVSVPLGTETELHLRAVHLRPAADRAFMFGDAAAAPDIPFNLLPPVYLLRIQVHHIPGSKEENNKIKQRRQNHKFGEKIPLYKGKCKHNRIDNAKPFNLNRYNEHQQHRHIRKSRRKGKENGHVNIIGADIHRTDSEKFSRSAICKHCLLHKKISAAHHQKTSDYRKKHSAENIDIVAVCSPRPL